MTTATNITNETLPEVSAMPKQRFLQEVMASTPGDSRLDMCIQCGTCGGSCPSAMDMDHSPRQLFALIRADMRDEVLSSNSPWYCVSCYFCTVRCPQDIHITDVMYTLKRMAIDARLYEEKKAADLSQTFVGQLEAYGRSFELGLATRHWLRHQPLKLVGGATFGLEMLSMGRLDVTPQKIEGIGQLKAILKKAKELEKAEVQA